MGDREDDERILRMVAMRASGQTITQVAEALGVPRGSVAVLTDRVRARDMETPDPKAAPADYARAYPWRRG